MLRVHPTKKSADEVMNKIKHRINIRILRILRILLIARRVGKGEHFILVGWMVNNL